MLMIGLFVVMVTLAAVPSMSVALVVTRSATQGFQSGAAAAAGIVVGDLVFLGLAMMGMAALAQSMGSLFVIVKVTAGLYLITLGIAMVLPRRRTVIQPSVGMASAGASFVGGLVITLGDVKAIVFYASLLPVFVDLGSLSVSRVILIAGITVAAVGGVKLIYAALAQTIVAKMQQRRLARGGEIAAGTVLMGTGTYMMVKA